MTSNRLAAGNSLGQITSPYLCAHRNQILPKVCVCVCERVRACALVARPTDSHDMMDLVTSQKNTSLVRVSCSLPTGRTTGNANSLGATVKTSPSVPYVEMWRPSLSMGRSEGKQARRSNGVPRLTFS